jgi:UDPglucose 6-dehydrogenase
VPIGTGDEVERLIRESNVDADVGVASKIRNFFVKERLMSDFKHPDRIVVGDR